MKFKIEIDCDNAQFADGELMLEVADTLAAVAKRIGNFECGLDEPLIIRDINGNTIGRATFEASFD